VNEPTTNQVSRRDVLKLGGGLVAASALAGVAVPAVHAAGSDQIQLALVGCGGRGTGAAGDALKTKTGPIKLVAMADVFPHRLKSSHDNLKEEFSAQIEVPEDHKFIGFDGAGKAMDCLKPGDVVILTTPPAFRWPYFKLAIDKKLNVFMEKPVTVDGPSSRRMLKLNEEALAKGIKVAVGLMCRHCDARHELLDHIKGGEIGEITMLRAYRQAGPTGSAFASPRDPARHKSELLYQIASFHGFLWASGGAFSDFLIHNIDECCWMKGAWPVVAHGSGGRHYRGNYVDQNFDSYSTEYTFADGSKLWLEGRTIPGCRPEFASYAHGTKGCAVISTSGHTPARCRTFKGQSMDKDHQIWAFGKREPSPYQLEWDHFTDAIRNDKPYNEVKRGVEASVVTCMGRFACHTGQAITYDEMLNHEHEFAPNADALTLDGPSPLPAGADGKYPVPQPGIKKKREY
jgi:predicted dehydrogenase